MTDEHPPSNPVPEPDDVDVDVRAFLPEGVALAGDEEPAVDDLDARPEPEIPAWARDEPDEPIEPDEPAEPDAPIELAAADEPAAEGGRSATEEVIDLTALDAAEVAMAEVEDALAAIDAGDLDRSPLLARLLADDAGGPVR